MKEIGVMILTAGWLVNLGCWIWLLVIAFSESVEQGLLNLFVPLYSLFYLFTRWNDCKKLFLCSLGSVVVTFFGMALRGNGGT